MNKNQLAQELSEKTSGASRAQVERILDEMTKTITAKLIAGEEVVFAGFGAFSSKKRKGRVGVNPRNTKEAINIPSVTVARFKPGKNLKDSLKKSDPLRHSSPPRLGEAGGGASRPSTPPPAPPATPAESAQQT